MTKKQDEREILWQEIENLKVFEYDCPHKDNVWKWYMKFQKHRTNDVALIQLHALLDNVYKAGYHNGVSDCMEEADGDFLPYMTMKKLIDKN